MHYTHTCIVHNISIHACVGYSPIISTDVEVVLPTTYTLNLYILIKEVCVHQNLSHTVTHAINERITKFSNVCLALWCMQPQHDSLTIQRHTVLWPCAPVFLQLKPQVFVYVCLLMSHCQEAFFDQFLMYTREGLNNAQRTLYGSWHTHFCKAFIRL